MAHISVTSHSREIEQLAREQYFAVVQEVAPPVKASLNLALQTTTCKLNSQSFEMKNPKKSYCLEIFAKLRIQSRTNRDKRMLNCKQAMYMILLQLQFNIAS